MAKYKTLRRLASDILKVGETKIKFDAGYADDFKSSVTREDVKALIKAGAIFKVKKVDKSKEKQAKKNKKQGQGRKRGTKNARTPRKEQWVKKVRAQRDELKKAVESLKLTSKTKRKFYSQISGGKFKSRADLRRGLESERMSEEKDNLSKSKDKKTRLGRNQDESQTKRQKNKEEGKLR